MKVTIPEALGYSVLGFAIVFLMLIILMGIIVVMGKVLNKKEEPVKAAAPAPAPAAPAVPKEKAPGSAGSIDLHGVDPRKAAILMAIVADELGKPVNELRFISIREIEA